MGSGFDDPWTPNILTFAHPDFPIYFEEALTFIPYLCMCVFNEFKWNILWVEIHFICCYDSTKYTVHEDWGVVIDILKLWMNSW